MISLLATYPILQRDIIYPCNVHDVCETLDVCASNPLALSQSTSTQGNTFTHQWLQHVQCTYDFEVEKHGLHKATLATYQLQPALDLDLDNTSNRLTPIRDITAMERACVQLRFLDHVDSRLLSMGYWSRGQGVIKRAERRV